MVLLGQIFWVVLWLWFVVELGVALILGVFMIALVNEHQHTQQQQRNLVDRVAIDSNKKNANDFKKKSSD